MNTTGTHILSEHGILAAFSIAKKISHSEITKLSKELKLSEDSKEFQEHLKKQILRDTQLALYNNKVPGIISNEKVKKTVSRPPVKPEPSKVQKSSQMDEKKKAKFALFATLIVQKILEQRSTTEEKCFLLLQIVNGLGLKQSDFKKFQNQNPPDEDDIDDIDDDDYDEGEG